MFIPEEKGSVPETGANNGYIPANAKVPITITANPMHSEVRSHSWLLCEGLVGRVKLINATELYTDRRQTNK